MGSMRKRRLSHYKQGRLVEHFVAGTTARTAASLCGVNRKTAALYFLRLREIVADELEAESAAMFDGEIEVDESYFGGRRNGKRGRGAAGKIPVFGLLKRGGKVYTKIIPNASSCKMVWWNRFGPILAAKATSTNAALAVLPKLRRKIYRKAFSECAVDWWLPDQFWNTWKTHLEELELLTPYHSNVTAQKI